MNYLKKISIVMCTFNGEKFIEEQLDSILNQTYPLYEIIIQDDCSTDNTFKILKDYEKKFEIIKVYQNYRNIGVHKNFLSAYLYATGDYIAPSDQDDIWKPYKIEFLINIIGDKLLAHSQSEVRYFNSKSTDSFSIKNPYISVNELIWDNKFPGHAYIFHKDVKEFIQKALEIYLADVVLTQSNSHDHVAPLVALTLDSVVITDKILQVWRRHPNVCNQQYVYKKDLNIIKRKNGYSKFFNVIKSFAIGIKSKAIKDTFSSRSKLLYYIQEVKIDNVSKNTILLIRLCQLVSDQTIRSYIKAGIICVKLHNFGVQKKIRERIGEFSFSFRYPFTYWYNMHKEEYL